MKKLAYPIRAITTAPFVACALFTLLYLLAPSAMSDGVHYLFSLLFFTGLPLSAYFVARHVPSLKVKGRPAERKLAIIFSVIGYLLGIGYLALCGGTRIEWMVYLTYTISGVAIALFSFVFRFKASGHACGVSGPIAMLAYCLGAPWLGGYLLLPAVFWASLQMKRHTVAQLAVGTVIPVMTIAVLARILP